MSRTGTGSALALLIVAVLLVECLPVLGNPGYTMAPPSGITIPTDTYLANIQANGSTYTLTGNITDTLIIIESGITLDGAGYTLQGSGSGTGIFIGEIGNITIKNITVTNWQYGIETGGFTFSNQKKTDHFSGNTFINNTYGIGINDYIGRSEISNNTFIDNTHAVSYSRNVIFRNNQFQDNLYSIQGYSDDADDSNVVNLKPMIYWINQTDKAVPSNAGWVTLIGCRNITIEGLNLDFKGSTLSLHDTTNSTVKRNYIANCVEGIFLRFSSQNEVVNNLVECSSECGIKLEYSDNNTIRGNQITTSKVGLDISVSSINTITNNKIVNNTDNAINIKYTGTRNFQGSKGPNTISQNIISENGNGIFITDGTDEIITYNNITENLGWGIKLQSAQQNNVIQHNNFIDNNVTDRLQVAIGGYYVDNTPTRAPGGPISEPQIDFVAGRANFWDDGSEGNYWSDYVSLHANASENGAVWDMGFYINENNMDHYPLTEPVTIAGFDSKSLYPPLSYDKPAQELPLTAIILAIAVVALVVAGLTVYFRRKSQR
jgi:parallel beta-helix repeat protein